MKKPIVKNSAPSIQARLLKALLIGLPTLWLLVTAITTYRLWAELKEVDDSKIVQLAYYLLGSSQVLNNHYGLGKTLIVDEDILSGVQDKYHMGSSDDDYMGFAIWSPTGKLVMADSNGEYFSYLDKQGFVDVAYLEHSDGLAGRWRLFYGQNTAGYRIAVGQSLESRTEVIKTALMAHILSAVIGLGFFVLWVWWSVRFGFMPLQALSDKLANRQGRDYTPLPPDVPKEISPLVKALNHWMANAATTLEREERFTADASHELRTPLAALRLHADLLEQAVLATTLDDGDAERLFDYSQKIKAGVERSTHLTDQLLVLAKLAPSDTLPPEQAQSLDWYAMSDSVLNAVNITARQKLSKLKRHISDTPWQLTGNPMLIELLLINLLDNAIRYCPNGSVITLHVGDDFVAVRDNGHGVAAADLARLSERFFRPAGQVERGSGLGLSIVRRICELHKLSVHFDNITDDSQDGQIVGFEVRVCGGGA